MWLALNPEPGAYPGDTMVTLEDGRELPMKKTICVPKGNLQVPAGKRVKLTAKLRQEADEAEIILFKAAESGSMENMRDCLAKGTDVNCRASGGGGTPLCIAAVNGHLDVTKLLVDAGADPELGNAFCDTPLSIAAQWDRMSLVCYYLEVCRVDPRQWNDNPAPQSPLDRSVQNGNTDMETLITEHWSARRTAPAPSRDARRSYVSRRAGRVCAQVQVSGGRSEEE